MMKIIVNCRDHEIEEPRLTYEDVVRLAKQSMGASVMYSGPRRGDMRRSGILAHGESVLVEDGMIFDAVHTGNA